MTHPTPPLSVGSRIALVALSVAALSFPWLGGCGRSTSQPASDAGGHWVKTTPTSKATGTLAPEVAPPPQSVELLPANETYAVIAGVLSWPDKGLGAFSTRARKDAALAKLLAERGVPDDHVALLLDERATTKAILAAVRDKSASAPIGSTLLFYYAGHGVRAKDGKAYFASRDMDSSRPAATGLSLDALAEALARGFKGSRVLLMADCCYSGALKRVATRLSSMGVKAISLTSAAAANVSTNNWTYTQAILDALGGDPLCDENGDGTITVGEMASEVRAAMFYREGQRYGLHLGSMKDDAIIATTKAPAAGKLPADRRRYAEVKTSQGDWQTARVRAVGDGTLTARLFDYSESTDIEVATADSRPLEFRRYAQGDKIEVYWGNKIWPAVVERVDGELHYISYPGWEVYWNEWVTSRRIVNTSAPVDGFVKDDPVMVEWRGKWWPAVVLDAKGGHWLIHYDGFGDVWDEWVGPKRLRKR